MKPDVARRTTWACACVCATLSFATVAPLAEAAKSSSSVGHVKAAPVFPVPASARVHGEAPKTTTAPSTTTTAPASTTTSPATTSPATTTASPARSATTPTTAPATPPASSAQGGIPTPGGSPSPPSSSATAHPGAPTTLLGAARLHKRASSSKLSTTAIVGAAAAALLVLLCLIWAAVRWLAIEPRWTRSLAYSLEETSFRASATWAELLDWARLGR